MKHCFYCSSLEGATVPLPEEEAAHALRVLRLRDGDPILLVDGKGTTAGARLIMQGRHECLAEVVARQQHALERKARVHLAVAPTKQIDRFEWMLEKCTEIGVDRITPLMTHRTERAHLRHDRLNKVLISAMKQSQRAWLPVLDEPTDLKKLFTATLPEQLFFGWCEGDRTLLTSAYRPTTNALLLIGPEGDFTPDEAADLRAANFQPVSLGEARLRTETAAVAACTWMNFAQHV
jgi:16S rRNA (uracil1498-N3)-methyltransferase